MIDGDPAVAPHLMCDRGIGHWTPPATIVIDRGKR
jgi:hypothetical protein